MELHSILVPFDFSEAAGHAARYAAGLADRIGADVTIMHVVPPPHYDYAMSEPSPEQVKSVGDRRLAKAREALDSILPTLADPERVRCEVVAGDAADEIVTAANSPRFDAVVMSTRGASAIRRWFTIGSVTSKVLHGADRPVITSVHFEHHPLPVEIRRVLCAVDLGPQSRRVLCWGARAAAEFGASLDVLHAAPAPESVAGEDEASRWRTAGCSRLSARIQELQRDMKLPAIPHIMFDHPARAVSDVARKTRTGLVVIGRGVSQDFIGRLRATAYDIIRQCPCPVVSI